MTEKTLIDYGGYECHIRFWVGGQNLASAGASRSLRVPAPDLDQAFEDECVAEFTKALKEAFAKARLEKRE